MSDSTFSKLVAKERLKLMMEAEPIECRPELMNRMKQEVSEIIGRYFATNSTILEHKLAKKLV